MKNVYPAILKLIFSFVTLAFIQQALAQTPQPQAIKDFAIWGGSAAGNNFNKKQGVFLKEKSLIIGNIGSNHLIDLKGKSEFTGNFYSGNAISLDNETKITGNLFALLLDSKYKGPAIEGKDKLAVYGNLTANGMIEFKEKKNSKSILQGIVAVPAPSSRNFEGPTPTGGITNTFTLPGLPVMPNNTPFDNLAGNADIKKGGKIKPGAYGKLDINNKKTITFDGPGNYIFTEVEMKDKNMLIFDFKGVAEGTINIYVVKEANWGGILVKKINSNANSKIFTEVHGDGKKNKGNAFSLKGGEKRKTGEYIWLGSVWTPNGGIEVKDCKDADFPHILGALWSGTSVDLDGKLMLTYNAPAASNLSYIDPYYTPPTQGKVTPANDKIGAELFSLSENPNPFSSILQNDIFRFDGTGKVMIEVISKIPNDNTLKAELLALGLSDTIGNGPHTFVITGFFPINQLQVLNINPRIEYVRPLYPAILNAGQVITQGDTTMRSYQVRERFGVNGTGVKIGVLSDSYNAKSAAQNDVDQGDLPGVKSSGVLNNNPVPIQLVKEYTNGGIDEGRAMLQIVHDIAPGANLAFRTGFLSAGDFAKGIQELADPNLSGGRCDVIVDDLSYITEPFLKDGVVAKVVDEVVSQGVSYFTSAGNFGSKSYEGVFNGVTNSVVIAGPAQIHQFGGTPSEIYQSVRLKPGSYTIVLQWDDEFHSLGDNGVQTDMDLYLVGANGFTLFGFNRSNLFKDPFEVCPFTVKEETVAKIMVVRASGNTNVRFKYIIFRGDATILDYQSGTSTIVGHANAKGSISVGAMLFRDIQPFTPIYPGVASFSSRGGTFTLENNNFAQRNKPDLIGPNGVNTTVNLGGAFFNDGDPYPNFFGTSAAAPHVAAVGALLIQAQKKFNLATTVTPQEIRQQLTSSAGKFSYLPGNFSFEGGFGYTQADSALLQIANARPIVDSLLPGTPGAQNSNQPFMVKIKGKYLTESTLVYINGIPTSTQISADKTEATAMSPAIAPGEDPAFQLYNAAKSPSGEDGGLSEAKFFFSESINVTVKAGSKTRKYGESNPSFDATVLINGVPIEQTDVSLTTLKLDGSNINFTTLASEDTKPGVYGIFPERTTPLDPADTLLNTYRFAFASGALAIEKMPLKITPVSKQYRYGEFPGDISYEYELNGNQSNIPALLDFAESEHKKFLADNGLVVIKGFNNEGTGVSQNDLLNMSVLTSFQSVLNAKKYILQNGQLKAIVNTIDTDDIGEQRFIVEAPVQSLFNYKQDSAEAQMVSTNEEGEAKAFLSLKALARGEAKASLPNGQLQPMVNGQLMAMVNGQLKALVNGQLKALVNGTEVDAQDIAFQNGQLLALVNGEWLVVTNGQLKALVNGQEAIIELSVELNGQLKAIVNGQLMPLVNGQLQAIVNGQLLAIVNGQLQAIVNGQLVPLVNGQLKAIVNGQLKAIVNGQLLAIVNGQLMALVNGELETVTDLNFTNGQLKALVNGQLKAIVNGQLKAMVNGVVTDIPTNTLNLTNGQLKAIVNGQLVAMVNGQLKAIVNGQLQPLVNGDAVAAESVIQLANGQLKALVNGQLVPIVNGQLKALVNGQLLAMVNGQLMAIVNGEVSFTVFQNGQLKALVNGQLQPLVNGQLKAIVNGSLDDVDSYSITNGQLKAIVNGEIWVYPNGQLKALVNGQLKALVNNFDVSGTDNNAKTLVLVDENDLLVQGGDVGGMFGMAMITGLEVGTQTLVPGAFINENFAVTYGTAAIEILTAPLTVKAADTTREYGSENPQFRVTYDGFAYDNNADLISPPQASSAATTVSLPGQYPIQLTGGAAFNYSFIYQDGQLIVGPKTLIVRAENKTRGVNEINPPLTITYEGLIGTDTKDSICLPYKIPAIPTVIEQLERTSTYTNIKINGQTNVYLASPGEALVMTGNRSTFFSNEIPYCPGCITQLYITMSDGNEGVNFTECNDVSGVSSWSQVLNRTFNAPTTPGVYYITQEGSWEFNCYDNNSGLPSNNPDNAIAVVVVNVANEEITASTTATITSLAGDYHITLQACNGINPKYSLVLENGILTIDEGCVSDGHIWAADGNFLDQNGTGNGTPNGAVTATGEGRIGSNSFSFNGTGGFISTGTGGSVSGTGDFSVSAWVKTTSDQPMMIINQRDDNVDGEYILKIGGNHFIHTYTPEATGRAYFMIFDINNNPLVLDLFSNTLVNDGNWHFIKGERKGTTINLYVDGVLESSAVTPGVVNLNPGIQTFIGGDLRDTESFFDGLIDDIRVSICTGSMMIISQGAPEESGTLSMMREDQPVKIEEDKVFPNPASFSIRVQLKDDLVNPQDLIVFDQTGKAGKTSTRKLSQGVYEVNISGLSKGLYFVRARTTGGIKTLKFVKF